MPGPRAKLILDGLTKYRCKLDEFGFFLQEGILGEKSVAELLRGTEAHILASSVGKKSGSLYGARNILKDVVEARKLTQSSEFREIVEPILGSGAIAVRGLYFDKTLAANWTLGWHQDRAIAVRQRCDVAGYRNWTSKGGVPHVFPPAGILSEMLTLRVHLDDCDCTNGALWVLPGTHTEETLNKDDLEERVDKGRAAVCEARRGDVLVMRPLLAHRSGKCHSPRHRRVIHIEYAKLVLPLPLEWATALPLGSQRFAC